MRARLLRGVVIAALLGALTAAASAVAENVDPGGTGAQFAWGENVGWINAEPSGEGGPGAEVSGAAVTGFMWGENIGWINLSCTNNGTCGTVDYGITNDGAGNLSGYAWGENVGWISFACANQPLTCASTGNYGVTIDPATGEWNGYAWGENIGWINFGHNQTASRIHTDDGDGVDGATDNCAFDANPLQTNTDGAHFISDQIGDACDDDDDNDGYSDDQETAISENQLLYCPIMRADVNEDGAVNILDFADVGGFFSQTVPPAPERYEQDGVYEINILDLATMAAVFLQPVGDCP